MKRTYTNNPIIAEQFTDDCIPNGVMVADPEFYKVLIQPYKDYVLEHGAYIFKLPQPDESDVQIANNLDVPFPFAWIEKGDYVLTYKSGYSRTEDKDVFERDYWEITIKD
jgi:hypothetical protein